jgi:thiosulfate reductase cytochrome b subunit
MVAGGDAVSTSSEERRPERGGYTYYRHTLPVRVMHWINVVALAILFMSGLNIFGAHPTLNWGRSSYTGAPPVLEIGAGQAADGRLVGYTTLFGRTYNTTGTLGASRGPDGALQPTPFPSWLTIPGYRWLAMARTWHFFFAWVFLLNGLAFVVYAVASRHLARDLAPTGSDWRSFGASLRAHLRFRHPQGEAARRYNILQKLAYLVVIFGLLPLIVLMGLGMSPWFNAVLAGWVDLVGGRQSARTLHFLIAWLLVAFVLIHVFQVVVTGLFNNLRSMITGRYRIVPEVQHD